MAERILMVDTNLLLDHFRKTKREATRLFSHFEQFDQLFISAVTEYEVLVGATPAQTAFWTDLLSQFTILPFDSRIVETAVQLKSELRRKRRSIEIADLFIAATACSHHLSFDTLNRKHFLEIDGLWLLQD